MSMEFGSADHDTIVDWVANWLQENEYTDVRVALPNRIQPDPIMDPDGEQELMPDITAWKDGMFCIIEVETGDSLSDADTAELLRAFATHSTNTNGQFALAVPKEFEMSAIEKLDELGIFGSEIILL